jgi:hypothetical protein
MNPDPLSGRLNREERKEGKEADAEPELLARSLPAERQAIACRR